MIKKLLALAFLAIILSSCASNKPPELGASAQQPAQKDTLVVIKEQVLVRDTLRIRDSVYLRETESFRELQKNIDSLARSGKRAEAVELLKKQVHNHNNLDELGYRTLQLANLLIELNRISEAQAVLESFGVYKPAINNWIDSANALYYKVSMKPIQQTYPQKMQAEQSEEQNEDEQKINTLVSQIRNLRSAQASYSIILPLADSLRKLNPSESVLLWLEAQLPSRTAEADNFCAGQRKIAADNFSSYSRNQSKVILLDEAITALNKCLEKQPSKNIENTVKGNLDRLVKERQKVR